MTRIDGQLELGRHSVTHQDLAVPVSGIPIQINRTFATINRNRRGDSGYGGNLDRAGCGVAGSAYPTTVASVPFARVGVSSQSPRQPPVPGRSVTSGRRSP